MENAIRAGILYRNSPHPIQQVLEHCGPSALQVLGVVNRGRNPFLVDASHIAVQLNSSDGLPKLVSHTELDITLQVVLFDRPYPERMQYMSLEPISLSLEDKHNSSVFQIAPLDDIDAAERIEEQRKLKLVEKLRFHTVTRYVTTHKELALDIIITQINCSYDINTLLQKNIGLVRARHRRVLSVSERVVESATDLYDYTYFGLRQLFLVWIWPRIIQVFIICLMAHRIAGELVVMAVEWRPASRKFALKDISATAQQVDLRLQQFFYWPIQYLTLKTKKDEWDSVSTNHSEYIRFYNSLWLVANDIIIGIAVGTFIIENADAVAVQAYNLFGIWSLEGLRSMISWLMGYPAGLKLNNELANFLGDLFLWVIDYWAGMFLSFHLHSRY